MTPLSPLNEVTLSEDANCIFSLQCIFSIIDKNGDHLIEFEECLSLFSVFLHGDLEQKFNFCLSLATYVDGNCLERSQLHKCLFTLDRMCYSALCFSELADFVDIIFHKVKLIKENESYQRDDSFVLEDDEGSNSSELVNDNESDSRKLESQDQLTLGQIHSILIGHKLLTHYWEQLKFLKK